VLAAVIRYRAMDEVAWREAPLYLVDNDGWTGSFTLEANTRYVFHQAWTDVYGSWVED
jgi:starch synthase (maltosyl-transferring)